MMLFSPEGAWRAPFPLTQELLRQHPKGAIPTSPLRLLQRGQVANVLDLLVGKSFNDCFQF